MAVIISLTEAQRLELLALLTPIEHSCDEVAQVLKKLNRPAKSKIEFANLHDIYDANESTTTS